MPEVAMRGGAFRDDARQGGAILPPRAPVAATAVAVGAILVRSKVKGFPGPDARIVRIGT
ncbi:MAG: hypothetical protein AVDCRST_MAG19-1921 [uncultured Thermomicrobiales bacterium]|uniref:Uncharacterized protein n=1 Tax=uncultured Thermomicrobiales bacterium TaxID=1645740 RepID=A0A6J4UX92_9BACT|nr:MAG: hypothetical protein AVDCRST_MAG19-1921 [uncultured Thermomicrobiales bacterium]